MRKRLLAALLSAVLLLTLVPAAFAASDLDGHWAKKYIDYLADEDIINPSATTGKYQPDAKVTRAEFMRYINRAFHFTETASISYTDVPKSAWYYETVCIAQKYGYINGVGGGRMDPTGTVTRALVCEPRVLLLDEPLGALDLKLRKDMQIELKRIQQRTGITFIYVTHDQEEALTMSDRIVVMNHGVIQQVGSPTDIYNEPENAFVADFIGESNIIDGVMLEDRKVEFCDREFECVDSGFGHNTPVDVVIRPEDLRLVYAGDGLLQGVVESIVFKGVHYEMMVRTEHFTFTVHSTMAEPVGKTVGLTVIPFDIHIMHKSAEAQA